MKQTKLVSPYRIQHVLVESESRLHWRCNKGAWSRISLALSMECFLISLLKLHFLDTQENSCCNRLALSLLYFLNSWSLPSPCLKRLVLIRIYSAQTAVAARVLLSLKYCFSMYTPIGKSFLHGVNFRWRKIFLLFLPLFYYILSDV